MSKVETSLKLDADCTRGFIQDVKTIHFWHTDKDFDKYKWHANKYTAKIEEYTQKDVPSDQVTDYIFFMIAKAKRSSQILMS